MFGTLIAGGRKSVVYTIKILLEAVGVPALVVGGVLVLIGLLCWTASTEIGYEEAP